MALGSCLRRILPSSIWFWDKEGLELGFGFVDDEEFGFRIGVNMDAMNSGRKIDDFLSFDMSK